jgi:transposase-like protein
MAEELLSAREAARRLGVAPATLYDWLGRSDRGLLVIRGRAATVDYLQGGPAGRGRIRIAAAEVERLKDLMRVRPTPAPPRRQVPCAESFPGITVPLGRPD